jgi:hypothetical protein
MALGIGGCGGSKGKPAETKAASATQIDKAVPEPEPPKKPRVRREPELKKKPRAGYVEVKVGKKTKRLELLEDDTNSIELGASPVVVLDARANADSPEHFLIRVQGIDPTPFAGKRLSDARAVRGANKNTVHLALVEYVDPEGKKYGGSALKKDGVALEIETFDSATLSITGKVSGTLTAKDATTIEIKDGKFSSRFATPEELAAREAAAEVPTPDDAKADDKKADDEAKAASDAL